MNSICFVAQFPPPIHGLSKAVDTLYNSHLKDIYQFSKIDIKNKRNFFTVLWRIYHSDTDAFYFTISQSKGGNWRDLVLMWLMEQKQKPLIIHLHGGFLRYLIDKKSGFWQRKLNYRIISKATSCIVLGNSLKGIFQGIVPNERIDVVHNCIDDEYMPPSVDAKISELRRTETINILYLSNFIPAKGYREVLQMAEQIKLRGWEKRFRFHFAGIFFEEKEKRFFDTYVRQNGLENIVKYHGVVSGQKKNELLKLSHIFILLTHYVNEGQPISILEAMGNGMAIITTNHAGIPDIVSDDNGFICPKGQINVNAIVEYALQLYADRKQFAEICLRNYDCTVKKYTQQQYVENMRKVFEKVLVK